MPLRHHSKRKSMLFTNIQIAHRAVKRTTGRVRPAALPGSCPQPHPRDTTMSRFRIACSCHSRGALADRRRSQRRGQDHLPHQLVRAGRARRLLPGEGRGHLREGRPRRDDQDGRPAGERAAAPARRRRRRDDGLRLPGAEFDLEGPAGHHHRHLVPEGPARHHGPRPREGPRRPEGQDHPGRHARPHLVVALDEAQVRLHRRADAGLHVQPAAVLQRQERRAAVLSVVGAVPGDAEGHAGQVLPDGRQRLPALRHDDGDDHQAGRRTPRRRTPLRARLDRGLEELSQGRSVAGQRR